MTCVTQLALAVGVGVGVLNAFRKLALPTPLPAGPRHKRTRVS